MSHFILACIVIVMRTLALADILFEDITNLHNVMGILVTLLMIHVEGSEIDVNLEYSALVEFT